MSKRPSRQRTATKRFEYRQPSELLPSTEGRNTINGEAIDDDDQSTRGQADDKLETFIGNIPGRENGPKRDHCADTDSASPSKKRRRLTTRKESRTTNRSVLSDSSHDSPSGENLSGSGLWTELTKPPTAHEAIPHKENTQTARVFTNTDTVIEQWYADPYQRHRPDVQSFEQWCRSNLENSLRNQGLSIQRTQRILTWLLLCRTDGFRPLGDPKQRRRRKQSSGSNVCRKQSAPKVNAEDDNADITDGIDKEVDDITEDREQQSDDEVDDADNASMVSSTVAASNTPEAPAKFEQKDTTESTLQPSSQVNEKLTPYRYNNLPDGEKIQIIRERLKVFDVIYGKGMPKTDTGYWRERLDYMSPITNRARSVPKGGFRTQGHLQPQIVELPASSIALHNNVIQPIAYAMLPSSAVNHGLTFNQTVPHSRKVLTEDPDFGITRYPKNQTETPEGLEAFNSERQVKFRSRQEMANDGSKTAVEIREEEAEVAEIIVEAARKDLTIKRWDWETADAMRGFWVDIDSGKTTFDPKTFSFGPVDETWKRIRQRKEILARGGDEADRLLEKEAEEDRKEYERQKRREQVQRTKMYRLERMQQRIH